MTTITLTSTELVETINTILELLSCNTTDAVKTQADAALKMLRNALGTAPVPDMAELSPSVKALYDQAAQNQGFANAQALIDHSLGKASA